ncbi:Xaa-Pro peptidase family protein [Planococcus sp. CP5-4]|uniref:M24 family metallopeptidase n=1 Tax=unclassified Planococcus (in: firmicutes) TaxID=2662419 RepID=UPI001C24B2B9|nr:MULTISPECIES: Xaa-Pro peptidase family protein [unclassified Planococcus (in: firmicutes)]MBU9672761.1 Xaa-Pro peptidase family protein [Planococcus sp. CP5-4_YE]MBV0908533.1 Xaa-Pro peptidase family protein [Planococcus sp. CP5-4_UN]MBW6063302.1 Xaa-Pro peptidase family protein [Planococcus sp. CP5-4]
MKLMKLREQMQKRGLDSLLVTNPYNLRFITGFTGTAGLALITPNDAWFITDFRYTEQAGEQVTEFKVVQAQKGLIDEVARIAGEAAIERLAFEQDYMTFATYSQYQEKLSATLEPVSGLIEKLRMVKSQEELEVLKAAAKIADDAFEHICNYIKPGMTELQVSNELEFFMRSQGATSSSFDIIVASGLRSALPHGVASDKKIEQGDLITLDFGALYNGYVSDITRTVAVGEPSDKLKEIYQVVLDSQVLALEKIKPGMTGIEADAIARDYIKSKGYGEAFGHSTGHGIGLEVHEGPGLSFRSETVLEPGMAVTVEPGIYLPGIGGVRIEDDILITETGNERLTHSSKELRIL